MNELERYVGSVVVVPAETKKEINALVLRGDEIIQVTNDSEARTAGNLVRDIKSLIKVADDGRKSITRKLDTAKKKIMADADAILRPLRKVLERVGGMAEEYVAQKAEANDAAMREAIEQAAIAAEFGEEAAIQVTTESRIGGVRSRETWGFELENADEVPRQYCSPDAQLINAYIHSARSNGIAFDDLLIPGVRFIKKTTVY